jgi:hypothetical protein
MWGRLTNYCRHLSHPGSVKVGLRLEALALKDKIVSMGSELRRELSRVGAIGCHKEGKAATLGSLAGVGKRVRQVRLFVRGSLRPMLWIIADSADASGQTGQGRFGLRPTSENDQSLALVYGPYEIEVARRDRGNVIGPGDLIKVAGNFSREDWDQEPDISPRPRRQRDRATIVNERKARGVSLPGEALRIQAHHDSAWAINPGSIAIGESRPVVRLSPHKQPSGAIGTGRSLEAVAGGCTVVLVLEAIADNLGNKVVKCLEPEDELAIRGLGHSDRAQQGNEYRDDDD